MTWVDVEGYEGRYAVSEEGDVISLSFAKSGKPMPLKPRMVRRYMIVCLRKPGSEGKTFTVHSLVARAFIGPRPDGMHVNHIDGNRENNARSNLEYVTPSENQKHSFRIGLQCNKGERHSQARLNDAMILDIRERLACGELQVSIAKSFGVDSSHISRINSGESWPHVLQRKAG